MQDETRNLLLAIILSGAILFGYQYFVAKPQMEAQKAQQTAEQQKSATSPSTSAQAPKPSGQANSPTATTTAAGNVKPRPEVMAEAPRIKFDTPKLRGSISLQGGRFDDLHLVKYHETVNPKSPDITLLSPPGVREILLCRLRLGSGARLVRHRAGSGHALAKLRQHDGAGQAGDAELG